MHRSSCRVITSCLLSTPIPLLLLEALLSPLRVTLTHQSLSFTSNVLYDYLILASIPGFFKGAPSRGHKSFTGRPQAEAMLLFFTWFLGQKWRNQTLLKR